jgi:membrane protein required for beta-lactamase induction
MRLIAILLSLWANRYPRQVDRWRRPEPYFRYVDWLWTRLPAGDGGALSLFAALLPPIVLFALLQAWVGDWLLGLGEVVLGVWALLFLHGPGRIDDQLEGFLEVWRDGHLGSARARAAELVGREVDAAADAELPAAALEGLFWQSYRRLFGGIFWLLILGPVGAVALHLVALTCEAARRRGDDSLIEASELVLHVLDWLPARATALSYGLAGSFVHAVEAWRASQEEPDAGPRELVVGAGLGAAHLERAPSDLDGVEEALRDARDLVGRSLMVWIAVAALLTIAGWLY